MKNVSGHWSKNWSSKGKLNNTAKQKTTAQTINTYFIGNLTRGLK